jgi:Ca-activated chloride channel family protein
MSSHSAHTEPHRPGQLAEPLSLRLALLAFGLTWLLCSAPANAALDELRTGGALEARIGDETVPLPLLKTDMEARIQGDLATVRVKQRFENPYDRALHARYIFPLPENAAVFSMRMRSGDRVIEAEIHRKPEARAIFEAAKQRGNQAALLSQQRPNVFTQEIANLLPGLPIEVEIEYAHVVEKASGDYQFFFPMVVGPRFKPLGSNASGAPTREEGEPEGLEIGVWNLPASPPVAPPDQVDHERVGIKVVLDAGLPIQWVESPSHRIAIKRIDEHTREISLARGRTLDNRDFMLHYRLGSRRVEVGSTTTFQDGGGFVSLLLEPPSEAAEDGITPRELVFVLDCSGSMAGVPMSASKRFMRRTLPALRPTDHFRIIRFSESASEWSDRPMPATPANIRSGLAYVDALYGGGGTVMTSGIRRALAPPVPENALRLVVFLTDGYIGNDVEIVRLIQQQRGEARFFSFGIGNSVNRYLLQEMARVGRGVARIVLPSEDAERAADELALRLESPVLTDVEIEWGDAPVSEVFPREIPDLFLGQTVRVMGRYDGGGRHRVTVHGRIGGRPVELPLELDLPTEPAATPGDALPIIWARSQIEDKMISYIDPALDTKDREALQEDVTLLGLEHRLVTRWTSFVAVAREIVNPSGRGVDADVRVPQVEGVPDSAYPVERLKRGATPTPAPATRMQLVAALAPGQGFHGSAAPEPGTWAALAVLSWMVAWQLRRRRQRES